MVRRALFLFHGVCARASGLELEAASCCLEWAATAWVGQCGWGCVWGQVLDLVHDARGQADTRITSGSMSGKAEAPAKRKLFCLFRLREGKESPKRPRITLKSPCQLELCRPVRCKISQHKGDTYFCDWALRIKTQLLPTGEAVACPKAWNLLQGPEHFPSADVRIVTVGWIIITRSGGDRSKKEATRSCGGLS